MPVSTDELTLAIHVADDGSEAVLTVPAALARDLVSVFFFRCRSPRAEHRAVLRGLDRDATYSAEFHSVRPAETYSGSALMEEGFVCRLAEERQAEAAILKRR